MKKKSKASLIAYIDALKTYQNAIESMEELEYAESSEEPTKKAEDTVGIVLSFHQAPREFGLNDLESALELTSVPDSRLHVVIEPDYDGCSGDLTMMLYKNKLDQLMYVELQNTMGTYADDDYDANLEIEIVMGEADAVLAFAKKRKEATQKSKLLEAANRLQNNVERFLSSTTPLVEFKAAMTKAFEGMEKVQPGFVESMLVSFKEMNIEEPKSKKSKVNIEEPKSKKSKVKII